MRFSLYSLTSLVLSACTSAAAPTSPSPLPAAAATGPFATQREQSGAGRVLAPSLTLASSEAALATQQEVLSVDFDQLRDLWIRVEAPAVERLATATLYFHLPNGELFKTVSRVFSTDPTVTEAPGGLVPVRVFPAVRHPSGWNLDFALPIAGSAFARRPHVGAWTVRAVLTGYPEEATTRLDLFHAEGPPQ